jgi:hypothetical protein
MYLPASQVVHEVAAFAEYVPAAQAVHALASSIE